MTSQPVPFIKRKIKIWDSEKQAWRFIWVTNNPNKLTTLEGGGPTDEGYNWWREQYILENGKIYHWRDSESRDCDGPMDRHSEYESEIPTKKQKYKPVWKEISYEQRDYYAEMMGY